MTEDGIGCYGLCPIGPGSGFEMMVTGTYEGLAILGAETEFPIILTTRKTSDCCFLEMRGSGINWLHQHIEITYFDRFRIQL